MWESILKQTKIQKAGRRGNYKIYRDALRNAAFTVMENKPAGTKFAANDLILMREEIMEIAKTLIPTRFLGGFAQFTKNKFDGQMIIAARMMVANGMSEKLKTSRVTYKLTGQMRKSKEFGKTPPKRYSRELEEDIEEVVADSEFVTKPTLSQKVRQILMEGRKDGKPVKTKRDAREYNNKYSGVKTNIPEEKFKEETEDIEEMDSGCGCGCDGKDVSKASSKCTKRTKKTGSKVKGKKWTQCVPTAEKGKFRRANWGQAGVKVTGDSGDTKRKKSFRARHKCETCKLENGKKRYYSNQCLACRDW